jgi:hypothetical protein
MVAHICNPSTRELRQHDLEFKSILGYIARHCLKKTEQKKLLVIGSNLSLITPKPVFLNSVNSSFIQLRPPPHPKNLHPAKNNQL